MKNIFLSLIMVGFILPQVVYSQHTQKVTIEVEANCRVKVLFYNDDKTEIYTLFDNKQTPQMILYFYSKNFVPVTKSNHESNLTVKQVFIPIPAVENGFYTFEIIMCDFDKSEKRRILLLD